MSEKLDFTIESLGEATRPNPLKRFGPVTHVLDSTRLPYRPHYEVDAGVSKASQQLGFEVAGPREKLYFKPESVKAAIVTCGGLCPGLNAVIRSIVHQLHYRYGVSSIIGIRNGYNGFGDEGKTPKYLTPETVHSIHTQGGTVLGSSRGTPPTEQIVARLQQLGINVLFVVGGDGTMRGADAIWQEVKRIGLDLAVVGVPKTIDNDIPYVRRSFGFETAVGFATQTIHAAHTEAECAPNGIGLVKLMGRHSGYIAASAALASGHANFCLVPEVPFLLEGKTGLCRIVEERLRNKGHAVIVVSEGSGQEFFDESERSRDKSGNLGFVDIGQYLRDQLKAYFKRESSIEPTIKYIDPSYIIRASPANAADQLFCSRLAQNAVHAAMAGKSGMLIGYWHGQMTHVPIKALHGQSQSINEAGELWFNILENTRQPRKIGA
ncbi:MAG: ATP-dependent 6-phosphofructokinase [Planctomycetota bacterium]|nr:ATP-dependent 6-phosphofructokinase [Planctomycetota bacterium]